MEEDDYMSDNFLVQTESVRPGLSRGEIARRNEREKKHLAACEMNHLKPLKQREHEERVKGMSKALSSDNKGFAMLEKMGYKKGMGLGKLGTGRADPVPIEIKADRCGLGRTAELKRKKQIRERLEVEALRKRQKMMGQLKGDYKQRMKDKFSDRIIEKDLYSSQMACAHLDVFKGNNKPPLSWYWPPKAVEKLIKDDKVDEYNSDEDQTETTEAGSEEDEDETNEEEEDGEDEFTPKEKLEELTHYLRSTFFYCIWCGTSYQDGKDLAKSCPGNTKEDHN